MSAPIDTPGGVANPAPGTPRADPGKGATSPPDRGHNGSADYLSRIRSDPDFAEREARAHQSRADSAEAKLNATGQWMGGLERYRGQYSGDELAQFVDQYAAALGDPELRDMIQSFHATGRVSTRKAPDTNPEEDEYKTPEERRIEELERSKKDLETRLARQETGSGQQVLKEHLVTVFGEIDLAPEVRERVNKKLENQLRLWSQSDAGLSTIRGLMTPEGAGTVRALVYGSLTADEIHQGVQNLALRKENGLRGLSTGVLSGMASTGQEPPPEFTSALEAAQWAARNPGSHNSR